MDKRVQAYTTRKREALAPYRLLCSFIGTSLCQRSVIATKQLQCLRLDPFQSDTFVGNALSETQERLPPVKRTWKPAVSGNCHFLPTHNILQEILKFFTGGQVRSFQMINPSQKRSSQLKNKKQTQTHNRLVCVSCRWLIRLCYP